MPGNKFRRPRSSPADRYSANISAWVTTVPSTTCRASDSFPPVDKHWSSPRSRATRSLAAGESSPCRPRSLTPISMASSHYLLRAHVAPGYLASIDLLTRFDVKSVRQRRLCAQSRHRSADGQALPEGARLRGGLGAERAGRQGEGSPDAAAGRAAGLRDLRQEPAGLRVVSRNPEWRALDSSSHIEDPCLAMPLSVAALFDAAAANQAVVRLWPPKVIQPSRGGKPRRGARVRRKGGPRGGLGNGCGHPQVLETRGIALSPAQRRRSWLSRPRAVGPLVGPGRFILLGGGSPRGVMARAPLRPTCRASAPGRSFELGPSSARFS